ncbi:MAG: hypothetical protein QOG71_3750 [Pyrinomonadaceae bacterium]|nr:hypothetical protein [Pyrinomonadaceae bacterium]
MNSRKNAQPPGHAAKRAPVASPVTAHPPRPCVAQPKMATLSHMRAQPVAPPVYRPQTAPKVLQTKLHAASQPRPQVSQTPATSLVHRPQPAPRILPHSPVARPVVNAVQRKVEVSHQHKRHDVIAAPTNPFAPRAPVVQRAFVKTVTSSVVQAKATKFYPNLHPGAAVPVERSNIFTLDSFANQYRLRRNDSHTVNVPNMKYNFVRNREGQMLLHNRYRHPSLAEGQQVLYAGEVFFNNGTLQWWSNGSGHYQPDADGAEQADLPMDYFYSYQQIIKGEHLRK